MSVRWLEIELDGPLPGAGIYGRPRVFVRADQIVSVSGLDTDGGPIRIGCANGDHYNVIAFPGIDDRLGASIDALIEPLDIEFIEVGG